MKNKFFTIFFVMLLITILSCENGLLVSELDDTDKDGIPDIYEVPPSFDIAKFSGDWEYGYHVPFVPCDYLLKISIYENQNFLFRRFYREDTNPFTVIEEHKGLWFYDDTHKEFLFFTPDDNWRDSGESSRIIYDVANERLLTGAYHAMGDILEFTQTSSEPSFDKDAVKFLNEWSASEYTGEKNFVDIDYLNDKILVDGVYYPIGSFMDNNYPSVIQESRVYSALIRSSSLDISSEYDYDYYYEEIYFFDYNGDGQDESIYTNINLDSGTWSAIGDTISFDNILNRSLEMTFINNGRPTLIDLYKNLQYQ